MSVYKRGKKWWIHSEKDGQVFRQTLGTENWQEAKRKEKELIANVEAGKVSSVSEPFARMPFGAALNLYRRDRIASLSESTQRSELDHSKPLLRFFADRRINKITEAMILEYMSARHDLGLSNAKINKELSILIGILQRARRWYLFANTIKRLKVRKSSVGRALEFEEKLKLQRAGEKNPHWHRAFLAYILAVNTTLRKGEILKLRWVDIDFLERVLSVRNGKTLGSDREIPLSDDAFSAILRLRDQAKLLFGESLPLHGYVMFWWPGTGKPDIMRPAKGFRSAWKSMVREAGIGPLRFHDLRHTAITDLATDQNSDETIMSLAGHVDRRMMRHYSHIRRDARREAVKGLSKRNPRPLWDTVQTTVQLVEKGGIPAEPRSQIIEKNGGDDETRTRDLCRDRADMPTGSNDTE
ncbi:MAG TPA: site-specific integrase [Candidatus Limnocylindrales bacterium]|nr:site-specific integrase [Candidatus Limnocylindrales bacterium]